jgi:hypothetical protein
MTDTIKKTSWHYKFLKRGGHLSYSYDTVCDYWIDFVFTFLLYSLMVGMALTIPAIIIGGIIFNSILVVGLIWLMSLFLFFLGYAGVYNPIVKMYNDWKSKCSKVKFEDE